jgi:hypothetical protein
MVIVNANIKVSLSNILLDPLEMYGTYVLAMKGLNYALITELQSLRYGDIIGS